MAVLHRNNINTIISIAFRENTQVIADRFLTLQMFWMSSWVLRRTQTHRLCCYRTITRASRKNINNISFVRKKKKALLLLAANKKSGKEKPAQILSVCQWGQLFFFLHKYLPIQSAVGSWKTLADDSMQSRHHFSMILPVLLCTHLPLNSNRIQIKSNSKLFQM